MFRRFRQFPQIGSVRKPTAHDYVQSGLIAMWDGIENAGWGVHDPNATKWRDCVTGREMSLGGSFAFEALGVVINSKSGNGYADGNITLPRQHTMEIVCDVVNQGTYPRVICDRNNDADSRGAWTIYDRRSLTGFGYSGYLFSYYGSDFFRVAISVDDDGLIRTYSAGVLYGAKSTYTGSDRIYNFRLANNGSLNRGLDGRYFALRFYNRALTADEIAENYAVDKERFGLE